MYGRNNMDTKTGHAINRFAPLDHTNIYIYIYIYIYIKDVQYYNFTYGDKM